MTGSITDISDRKRREEILKDIALELKENGYDIPGFLHGIDILQFFRGSILDSLSKGNSVYLDGCLVQTARSLGIYLGN